MNVIRWKRREKKKSEPAAKKMENNNNNNKEKNNYKKPPKQKWNHFDEFPSPFSISYYLHTVKYFISTPDTDTPSYNTHNP